MNSHRRVSRGIQNGRPLAQDRRLPSHNARRRRQQQTNNRDPVDDEDTQTNRGQVLEVEEFQIVEQQAPRRSYGTQEPTTSTDSSVEDNEDNTSSLSAKRDQEIQHLKRRIQKVQESIQLSSRAITEQPHIYETNVLNVVTKTVNEWSAIVTHHYVRSNNHNNDNSSDYKDNPLVKETASLVFGLLQLSLQCGPLAGAKPGYFKRCGSEVAALVLRFLDKIIQAMTDKEEEKDDLRMLAFTEKQIDAIQTWRKNAQKAVEAAKPPSKSALKARQGKGKKQQK